MKPLLLVGGGGHCQSCIDIIENTGIYQIKGVVDPNAIPQSVLGYPVIGSDEDLPQLLLGSKFVLTKTVVFMVDCSFSSRDYDRFGIELWISREWTVFIFDFTKVKHEKYSENSGAAQIPRHLNFKAFNDKESALFAIDKLKANCLFIDMLGLGFFEYQCRKLAKEKGKIVNLFLGSIPSRRVSIFKKIWEIKYQAKKFFNYLDRFIFSLRVVHPSYVVVGGTESENRSRLAESKVIRAHNFDYDFF